MDLLWRVLFYAAMEIAALATRLQKICRFGRILKHFFPAPSVCVCVVLSLSFFFFFFFFFLVGVQSVFVFFGLSSFSSVIFLSPGFVFSERGRVQLEPKQEHENKTNKQKNLKKKKKKKKKKNPKTKNLKKKKKKKKKFKKKKKKKKKKRCSLASR